jgi:hypothetical protein
MSASCTVTFFFGENLRLGFSALVSASVSATARATTVRRATTFRDLAEKRVCAIVKGREARSEAAFGDRGAVDARCPSTGWARDWRCGEKAHFSRRVTCRRKRVSGRSSGISPARRARQRP